MLKSGLRNSGQFLIQDNVFNDDDGYYGTDFLKIRFLSSDRSTLRYDKAI